MPVHVSTPMPVHLSTPMPVHLSTPMPVHVSNPYACTCVNTPVRTCVLCKTAAALESVAPSWLLTVTGQAMGGIICQHQLQVKSLLSCAVSLLYCREHGRAFINFAIAHARLRPLRLFGKRT